MGNTFINVSAKSGFELFPDVNALSEYLKKEPLNGENNSDKRIKRNWTGTGI